jgi:hypothetical protein
LGSGDLERIQRAFLLTCGRPPDSFERESLGRFLDRQRALHAGQPEAEVRVWTDLCQSLLGLNAFLYLE